MINWTPTLIDRILMRIFRYQIISETVCEDYVRTGKEESGDAYLVRYFLYDKRDKGNLSPHLFLHHILKSDPDREHHDHPWDFTSLIIAGGYWDETPVQDFKSLGTFVKKSGDYVTFCETKEGPKWAIREWCGPGKIVNRKAEHTHKLFLRRPVWTLVYTRRKRRDWGFHTVKGWILWRWFLDHKCVDGQPK